MHVGNSRKHIRVTNSRGKCGNHLIGISPHNKCDQMRISGHEQVDSPKKTFHIPLLVQTNDDKGIKGAMDE